MENLAALQQSSKTMSVLYAEDDESVRAITARLLSRLFKSVDIVENGQEGLERYGLFFEENNRYYDIVVTDIEMPEMNGIEMSRKILKLNKEQKIIVNSAYNDKERLIIITKFRVE